MQALDSYARAIRSGNLRGEADTVRDVDILGAAGLAAKRAALAMALARLFLGDGRAADDIVGLLALMLRSRSIREAPRLKTTQAEDMARAVLAWHRDGTCRPCGGLGYERAPGAPALSDTECRVCRGIGKRAFEREFRQEWRAHARWLLCVVEQEAGRAGPAVMQALAPRLDL